MNNKLVRKDSVVVNVEKLEELMNGKSLRDYSASLGSSSGVSYKTLQRMKKGENVNENYAQVIADFHRIPLEQLLSKANENPNFSILRKISAVNVLFENSNFRFFRIRQQSKSISINTRYFYKCPIDESTSTSIKGFLDAIMAHKTEKLFSRNKSLEDEFSYLDALAKANKFIKELEDQNIYIFYGSYLSRQIDTVHISLYKKYLEDKYGEKFDDPNKKGTWPCLSPMTIYNENFVFRKVPYHYDKLKIFPNTGYDSFEDLKKDYLKVLKLDLAKFEKNEKDAVKILAETSAWLDYQENEKNWDLGMRKAEDTVFNIHKALPFTHLVKYSDEAVKKFKFNSKDMGFDILAGAKALVRRDLREPLKIKKVEKEKEDDHVDTSS